MRIPRVFHPQPCSVGTNVILDGQSAHYLIKVLRMSAGRELILFDGNGAEYDAVIASITKSTATLNITSEKKVTRQSPLHVHLGIGVSRGERFDWVLQKSTELGVHAITPLLTERVEVKLKPDRIEKKMQHWQQIIVSACEQCQLNVLPALHTPIKISQWLAQIPCEKKFVLDHRGEKSTLEGSAPSSAALLVGPEGGLNESEIIEARNSGFNSLQLGPRVLRTETAPISALSIMQFQWGDFR